MRKIRHRISTDGAPGFPREENDSENHPAWYRAVLIVVLVVVAFHFFGKLRKPALPAPVVVKTPSTPPPPPTPVPPPPRDPVTPVPPAPAPLPPPRKRREPRPGTNERFAAGLSNRSFLCDSLARTNQMRVVVCPSCLREPSLYCKRYNITHKTLPETSWLQKYPDLGATRNASARGVFSQNPFNLTVVQNLRQKGVLDQMFVDTKLKILYCAVPEAGSTLLKKWMLRLRGKDARSVHSEELWSGPRQRSGKNISDEEFLEYLGSSYFKFSFVRNPYKRVLSTFLKHFESCEKGLQVPREECRAWKREVAGPYRLSDDWTLKDFLVHQAAKKTVVVNDVNSYWLPQTQVCALDHIQYDFVGNLELESDMRLLNFIAKQEQDPLYGSALHHSLRSSQKEEAYYTARGVMLAFRKCYRKNDVLRLGYSSPFPVTSTKRRLDHPHPPPPTSHHYPGRA